MLTHPPPPASFVRGALWAPPQRPRASSCRASRGVALASAGIKTGKHGLGLTCKSRTPFGATIRGKKPRYGDKGLSKRVSACATWQPSKTRTGSHMTQSAIHRVASLNNELVHLNTPEGGTGWVTDRQVACLIVDEEPTKAHSLTCPYTQHPGPGLHAVAVKFVIQGASYRTR